MPIADAMAQDLVAYPNETETTAETLKPYVRITDYYDLKKESWMLLNAMAQLNGCDWLCVEVAPKTVALYRRTGPKISVNTKI